MLAHNVIDLAAHRKKETRVRQKINKGKTGSVYSRNGILWVDFIYLGKRIRESTYMKDTQQNRIDVRKWLDLLAAKIANNLFSFSKEFPYSNKKEQIANLEGRMVEKNPGDVLFGEYYEKWFKDMLPGMSSSKIRDYSSIYENYLAPRFSDTPFSDLTTYEMKKFLADLQGRITRLGKPLSPATIRNIFIPLRVVINDAIDEYGWREMRDPIAKLKMPSIQKFRVRPFNFVEWKKLIGCIPGWYRPYFQFAVQTGLRPSEQVALKWTAIDDKYIHIELSRVAGEEKTELKTEASRRMIKLRPDLAETLEDQRVLTKDLKGEYVFLNMDGNVINQTNLSLVWKLALTKSGLPARRMYETRHTFASWALAMGEPPGWVARVLGHVDTSMVHRTYGRYIPDLTKKDGASFGNHFCKN